MLVFAVLIALPLSFYLVNIRPNSLFTIRAALVFAAATAALSTAIYPPGGRALHKH